MKKLPSYQEFLNESKIDKMSKAWYYEGVVVPNLKGNLTTIKSDKDSTKAASALANYWEKGKSFDDSGFTITIANQKTLDSIHKDKVDEIVYISLVDNKTGKDFKLSIEPRDIQLGVPADKHLYVKVQRVG